MTSLLVSVLRGLVFIMVKNNSKPTVVDLFCGAGGLSEGFRMAGYKILLGTDIDKYAISTFKKNNKRAKTISEDIRTVSGEKIKELLADQKVDVVVGGPPCQGFSNAGMRDPNDPRNSLFMEFVRIVGTLRPEWIVMENVPGILTMKTSSGELVKDIILKEFDRIGYKVKTKILLAADYGVPQKRRRVIFLGTRTGNQITFPLETYSNRPKKLLNGIVQKKWIGVGNLLEKKVDKKYYHTARMIEGFKRRKAENEASGNGFGWQILDMAEPSYTISARYWKDGSDAIVQYSENKARMLTEREVARIQSFPDDYQFVGPKREVYRQIGNAVPCLLAKALAIEIKSKLRTLQIQSMVQS